MIKKPETASDIVCYSIDVAARRCVISPEEREQAKKFHKALVDACERIYKCPYTTCSCADIVREALRLNQIDPPLLQQPPTQAQLDQWASESEIRANTQ